MLRVRRAICRRARWDRDRCDHDRIHPGRTQLPQRCDRLPPRDRGMVVDRSSPSQSVAGIARASAGDAIMPVTDQTRTTCLVTLPGAFVGALMGGASPRGRRPISVGGVGKSHHGPDHRFRCARASTRTFSHPSSGSSALERLNTQHALPTLRHPSVPVRRGAVVQLDADLHFVPGPVPGDGATIDPGCSTRARPGRHRSRPRTALCSPRRGAGCGR